MRRGRERNSKRKGERFGVREREIGVVERDEATTGLVGAWVHRRRLLPLIFFFVEQILFLVFDLEYSSGLVGKGGWVRR